MTQMTTHHPTHPPAAARGPAPASHGDGEAYERLALNSPQGSIYCQPWWLDAVAPGQWRVLTVRTGDELHAAWPIVTERRGGREHVVMPPMTQKLGILFPPPNPERKYAEQLSREHQLMEELIEQLPTSGAFRQAFHEKFTNHLPFYWQRFQQTTRYTYLIDGLSDVDRVWKELRTGRRRAIRSGAKAGLRVTDDVDFEQMLDLNELTFRRQGMKPPVPRAVLRRMDQACLRHAGRRIIAVRDAAQRVHAAVYIAYHNRTAYYLLMGSDPDLRSRNGISVAMWEAIRFAASVADRFDFEGSMMKNVEPFVRDFGGRQTPYFLITRPAPPSIPARAVRKLRYVSQQLHTRLCAMAYATNADGDDQANEPRGNR